MILSLLSIVLIFFYTMGVILSAAITGWEINKVSGLTKILFWFIFIFIEK